MTRPKSKEITPSPYLEPLAWWLGEAMEAYQSSRLPKEADGLAIFAGLHRLTINKLIRRFVGPSAPPVLPIVKDATLRPPAVVLINGLPPIEAVEPLLTRPLGSPVSWLETLPSLDDLKLTRPIFGEAKLMTPLDKLPPEERRQVCAFGLLIALAWFAANQPTRIERAGPSDLNDPGDVVGVERIRDADNTKVRIKGAGRIRDVDERKIHAKGVCAKLIGQMIQLYGQSRFKAAGVLAELATGVALSQSEARDLVPDYMRARSPAGPKTRRR
jgi:hypothetical protein